MQETSKWVKTTTTYVGKERKFLIYRVNKLASGNTGGLVVVVSPGVRCQVISCVNPAASDFEQTAEGMDPIHLQQADLTHCATVTDLSGQRTDT